MKKLLLISAIAFAALIGCKKDEEAKPEEGNAVTYTIQCESCTATIDTRNGLNQQIEVKGFFVRAEMNDLSVINISTTGTGEIRSSIKINDKIVHDQTNNQTGNKLSYVVKF